MPQARSGRPSATVPSSRHPRHDAVLRRRAVLTAVGSVAAVAALWLLFVRTGSGRFLDDLVITSSDVVDPATIERRYTSLQLVSTASLAIGCLALVVIGSVRRRPLLGVASALVVGLSAVSTEFLKHAVIERPVDLAEGPDLDDNSFPSGHATISTALALALVMVTPRRWRLVVAAGGALWVVFQGTGVVLTGWHRPSDVLAGYAVALGWAALAVWGLCVMSRVGTTEELGGAERGTRWALVVLAVALGGLGVSVVTGGDNPFTWRGLDFLVGSVVVTVIGVGVVAWFVRLLHGSVLGVRPDPAGTRAATREPG